MTSLMKTPARLKRSARDSRAFTLLEVLVVLAIMTILASIAVPTFMQTRATSSRTACVQNLVEVEQAKNQLAMANNLPNGAKVDWPDVVPAFLKTSPHCPSGGTYTLNAIGVDPDCSLTKIGHHS